ncbi:hypothetical protein C8Q75DRAFT_809194 [Abortiporus biennis]|nr:hypothetical protein C8Q75DRAFT_809194 [Abortiporus biennis]
MTWKSESQQTHIVLFTLEAWGHLRPICSFIAKMVLAKRIYITLLTSSGYVDRIYKEISRYLADGHNNMEFKGLIRVIGIERGDEAHFYSHALYDQFEKVYESLNNEEPVFCAHQKKYYTAISRPDVAVIDFLHCRPIEIARRISGDDVRIYMWYPAAVGMATVYAPKHLGGVGDPRPFIQQEAQETGREIKDVAQDFFFSPRHELLSVPGLPSLYDHERLPQEVLNQFHVGEAWRRIFDGLDIVDGVFLYTAEELEPVGVNVMKEWLDPLGKYSVYPIGPLLPPAEARTHFTSETNLSNNANKIEAFMDIILKTRGPQSMLFISFGSLFFPMNQDKLRVVIDVVIEKGIPFIMCYGAHSAQIPEDVQRKIDCCDVALASPWVPQQAILAHPATSWFLSHCGQSGSFESITAGVPMICWPFHCDQPFNASNLTENFDVAYELFEVRSGNGLSECHRLGRPPLNTLGAVREEFTRVLDDAFGSGGERKRKNMKRLQEIILSCWKDGGSSKSHFDRFLSTLGSG